jgi:hypothetical protein
MKVRLPAMAYRGWVLLSFVGMGVVIACGVENVQAKDYNQGCEKDDDCILVDQLVGDGNECEIPCEKGAINRKDEEKYAKELDEEKGSCTSEKRAECSSTPVALCKERKCTQGTLERGDAG